MNYVHEEGKNSLLSILGMEYDNSHPGEAYLQWFHSYPISSPKRIS
jgi:hypothetical protein